MRAESALHSNASFPLTPVRLNWGCGLKPVPGWINSDIRHVDGVDLPCDILEGLPLPDCSIDYIVSIHALHDIVWMQLPRALEELRRVLKPGGALRLALPDMDRAIDAYLRKDGSYFYVPDEHARSVGSKFITQIIWYGSTRTPFTFDFVEELLGAAGFTNITRCAFKQTRSRYPAIVDLDDRERETMFIETDKPA